MPLAQDMHIMVILYFSAPGNLRFSGGAITVTIQHSNLIYYYHRVWKIQIRIGHIYLIG